MSDEFDWSDREFIAIPAQPKTACYLNLDGDLVIRQQGDWPPGDDVYVVIARANVAHLCRFMLSVVAIDVSALNPERKALAAPPPSAGAVRQRRYRQQRHGKHRDDGDGVTPSDADVTQGNAPEPPLLKLAAE
jgi:hypothetical protein